MGKRNVGFITRELGVTPIAEWFMLHFIVR